jgi:hypothetical protein
MRLFRFLSAQRAAPEPATQKPLFRASFRPRVECLESRTLLNARFVVPLGEPTDNVTNFASLAPALTTPGLASGDTITIRAGSAPGQVTGAELITPAVTNLTIQGDPTIESSLVPQFQLTSSANFIAALSGFALSNVNVGLINNGHLNFATDTNATITNSTIVNINATNSAIDIAGTNNVLANNKLIDISHGGNDFLAVTANGSNNLISGNNFVEDGFASAAIDYLGGSGTVTDRIVGNTIHGTATTDSNFLFFGILVSASISGLTIEGNTIFDNGPPAANVTYGIWTSSAQNTLIRGNVIKLIGASTVGILIAGASDSTSATLTNNQISTGVGTDGGTGLEIDASENLTNIVRVTAQGNDFHNNQIGVNILATTSTSPASLKVDLGGGGISVGGNNFRGTPAPASGTGGAILVTGTNPASLTVIQAQNNIFGPSVNNFVNGGFETASINTTGNPTGNSAFVQVAYEDFLHRPGDLSSTKDAGSFVSRPQAVPFAVIRSQEGLGVLIDGLYQKLLGRNADVVGMTYFNKVLQVGGTVEQVIGWIVASPEYRNRFISDSSFIQSLYHNLLGREGSSAEVESYLKTINTTERTGVAYSFVHSLEFRQDVVNQLFAGANKTPSLLAASVVGLFSNLLHRLTTPSASEVSSYVDSGADLLNIEMMFASSQEFFLNG